MQKRYVKIVYNRKTFKVKFTISAGYTITLPEEWAALLGFSDKVIDQTKEGDFIADFYQGVHNLHVFTDMSEPVIFGGTAKPYLGSVNVPKGDLSEPEVVTKVFEPPMYVRVSKSRFDTIRVYIMDHSGKPAHFRIPPVSVRLSLRRLSVLPS